MLNFTKENDTIYDVMVNDVLAGQLVFDQEQNAWVFDWGDDGTTYENSLKETKQELKYDFESGKNDDTVAYFGNYEY